MANSTSGTTRRSGPGSHVRQPARAQHVGDDALDLLVVLWRCGDPKTSEDLEPILFPDLFCRLRLFYRPEAARPARRDPKVKPRAGSREGVKYTTKGPPLNYC
jgi:hypothetical protein